MLKIETTSSSTRESIEIKLGNIADEVEINKKLITINTRAKLTIASCKIIKAAISSRPWTERLFYGVIGFCDKKAYDSWVNEAITNFTR